VSTDEATIGYRATDGHVVWSKPADADAPLAVTNNLVITTSRQSDPVDTFRALDRRTGRVRWESPTWNDRFDIIAANQRYVVVATGGLSSQPYTGPVTVVVLDARTGREQGRFDAGAPKLFYFNDVAIRDGLLIYAQDSSITARQLPNGDPDWRRRFTERGSAENLARSTDDATVFALGSGAEPRVTALDAATGRERWSRNDGSFRTAGPSSVVFAQAHPGRTLIGVDVSSGARTWRYEAPPMLAPDGLGAADLAVASAGGRVAISNGCDTG
jgi:outer membrane protein assembly factor BamB